jgi:dihydroneopterin aldolase
MQELATYRDVVAGGARRAAQRVDAAVAGGVDADRLVVDPGLGFAKTAEHNWLLQAHLDEIISLGHPVLVGASRKSYLGALLADERGVPRGVDDREAATVATTVLSVQAGAWGGTRARRPCLGRRHQGAARHAGGGRMTATITLTGLRAKGHHGVYDIERAQGQDFVVDVVLELDLSRAAATDDVVRHHPLWRAGERLVAVISGEPVNLIETLADRLLTVALADQRWTRPR